MVEPIELSFKALRSSDEVQLVAELAACIWREYYVPIIGAAQVDYMLDKYQSAAAMQEQMARGDEYFMIAHGEQLLGYLAVRAEEAQRSLFISKLYLQRQSRGAGAGRRGLQFIERLALERNLELLWLTVNKHNPAQHAYEKWGFVRAADLRIDIGAGFVMDDFRMEKRLDVG